MERELDDNTVMMAGCVGDPMFGAIDPIPELAAIAHNRGIHFHVDAAWGGFIIPFLQERGLVTAPPWDFSVDGVSSITSDPHKLLFCPMPAGGILFRDEAIRANAHYVLDDPLLGLYETKGLVGSHSGASVVCLWALLKTMAYEGYAKTAEGMMAATRELVAKATALPGIESEMEPKMNLTAFRTDVDAAKLAQEMGRRGWKGIFGLADPPTIRCIVLPYMRNRIDRFVDALSHACESLR